MSGAPVATEARKVVTVLFTDMRGSTRLGEVLDPEAMRHVLSRYFDGDEGGASSATAGVVTKFIGDAVMAVFGVPPASTRTTRCAPFARPPEMRDALDRAERGALRTSGASRWRSAPGSTPARCSPASRAGGQSFVVGDAVNTAARLEQRRAAGRDPRSASDTYRLVHEAVLGRGRSARWTVKGKAEPRSRLAAARGDRDGAGWSAPARLAARRARATSSRCSNGRFRREARATARRASW